MATDPSNPVQIPRQDSDVLDSMGRFMRVWWAWLTNLTKSANASHVAGPNEAIQYNDNGQQAGDANLTWDKTNRQVKIVSADNPSALLIAPSFGITPYNSNDYAEIDFGAPVPTNASPAGTNVCTATAPAIQWWDSPDYGWNIEVHPGQTVGANLDATKAIYTLSVHRTADSGLGARMAVYNLTTSDPGGTIGAGSNSAGSGAPGTVHMVQKDGVTVCYVWQDSTGAMRFGNTAPTPTSGDLIGTLFGTGSGSVTSVDATVPTDVLAVSGVPITGAGTIAITKATETANFIAAGPTSGAAAQWTFRAMVADDLPSTAVTPGTYGDSTHVAQVTVDQQGRLTAASNVAMAGGGGGWIEGLFRGLGDGSTTVFPLPDIAESVLFASVDGAVTDPLTYTLAADGGSVTFGTAPASTKVITINYEQAAA